MMPSNQGPSVSFRPGIARINRRFRSGRSRWVARTRGQVMILGAVSLLIMALMLMASFAVSNAIHEKIRIQAHADAQAYSLAVLEARSFNTISHYNRAIAATLVAQMSLHSWMAIATANVSQLVGEEKALGVIIGKESKRCPKIEACCAHAAEAEIDQQKVSTALQRWKGTLEGKEQSFNNAVRALREMAEKLHSAQNDVLEKMWNTLQPDSTVMVALKKANASASDYSDLTDLNRKEFACALEGSRHDQQACPQRKQREKAGAQERSAIMLHAADAARHKFHYKKDVLGTIVSEKWNKNGTEPKSYLSHGQWSVGSEVTNAGVSDATKLPTPQSNQASSVGAQVGGFEVSITRYHESDGSGSVSQTTVYSNASGGQHQSEVLNDTNHSEFKGVMMEDPCQQSTCFVNYRALPSPTGDFGQPSVYGGASQNLRLYHLKAERNESVDGSNEYAEHAPWEINKDGKIQIEIQRGKPAVVNYVARGRGYAVSKARVYFHQLGDWTSPPNFFDPFWRAKLHFFSRDELREVLQAAGDQVGSEYLNAGAPVEGADQ